MKTQIPTQSIDSKACTPQEILRRARLALIVGRGLTRLAIGSVLAGIILAAWLWMDSIMHFGSIGRWTGFAAILLPLATALAQACHASLCRMDDAALARRLEIATGCTDNSLVNSVQLERTFAIESPWHGIFLKELSARWQGLLWRKVYHWRLLWCWSSGIAVIMLIGGIYYFLNPEEFRQRLARVLLPAHEIAAIPLADTILPPVTVPSGNDESLAKSEKISADSADQANGSALRDLIGRVELLFDRQKNLHQKILNSGDGKISELAKMVEEQDSLADESQLLRKALADGSQNSSLGTATFRSALGTASNQMGSAEIYEQMIRCAENIERKELASAADTSKNIILELARILELLNTSQHNDAVNQAAPMKDAVAELRGKLNALIQQQQIVVEKSKSLAAKDEMRPEDSAEAKELAAQKLAISRLLEQMLIDAHLFPDLRPMNELREELTKIYEDVIQQDALQAASGQLKPSEIAVQKEESLLEAIEKAAATAEDMEMWLPDKNETTRWLMENFDLTEMPEIPNIPLADAFTDLVGDLLQKQEGLAEQVQDASSNNALAVNPANGWEVADGPMPGFNAQGKSGNTAPNKNEQTGRSSGGREGMSSGEMVNQRADHLEGSSSEARRTNDPQQQGKIQDDGPPANAKATGGGKAGGTSQRAGMTGQSPLRSVNTPRQLLNDALAAEQALLARQTAKSYSTASLLYHKTGPMSEIAKLMDESREALQSGRIADYQALHQRIASQLRELANANPDHKLDVINDGKSNRFVGNKRLPGGADVTAPGEFQPQVDEYFRSLDSP